MNRALVLTGALSFALALGACSPEASRTRGDGPGADTGNRTAAVELHPGGSEANFRTPNLNPPIATAAKK